MNNANAVVDFWLKAGPKAWFAKNDDFDREINRQFGELYLQATSGALAGWQNEPESSLALILLLDQFSRNIFRDDPRAFAQDEQALSAAKISLEKGFDTKVAPLLRQFFYMPFMHSESLLNQRRCVHLFHCAGLFDNLKYAILHRDIIERFGRFPHRNNVLARPTSQSEQAFLDGGGFSG